MSGAVRFARDAHIWHTGSETTREATPGTSIGKNLSDRPRECSRHPWCLFDHKNIAIENGHL
jgi:GT2 family glycosyltransferase